ncbi:hypothetical protein AAFN60_21445 [Roseibacillus persicicus]|uniref:hypothetical protein n=1 Tax=Roseibacillus persicicus TaxID=454148 RepID=UPI00398ABC27
MSTINIDFGLPGAGPADSFGGAGTSGFWNVVDRVTSTGISGRGLVDVDGIRTSVIITTSQSMSDVTPSSQPFSALHAPLLGDYLVGGSNDFTLSIFGLQEGVYEFILYTTGRQDFTRSSLVVPNVEGVSGSTNTGVYDGELVEGVTHARFELPVGSDGIAFDVSSPSDGFINGIQIAPVPEASGALLLGVGFCLGVTLRNRANKAQHHKSNRAGDLGD